MKLKNTRPTIIELPNGSRMGPGEEVDFTQEQFEALDKNPGGHVLLTAKFLVFTSEDREPVKVQKTNEEQTAEAKRENAKQMKLKAIENAKSIEELSGLAANERDADILQALNTKANTFTGK